MPNWIKDFSSFASVSLMGMASSTLIRVQTYEYNVYHKTDSNHLLVTLSQSTCHILNPIENSFFKYWSEGLVYSGQILYVHNQNNSCLLTLVGDEANKTLATISYPIGSHSILWELFK